MRPPLMEEHAFYGTAVLGEKGQIVVPAEARDAFGLKKGDKLLVLGMGKHAIVMMKLSGLEQIAKHLSGKLSMLQGVLKSTK